MIATEQRAERAILVGAPRRGTADARERDEHLDELARLADTAGAHVVGRLTQQVHAPSPASYIGRGKMRELAELVDARDATLVLFDEELSPAQGKNLEEAVGVRIMDRAELILDIFARRARTHEARLQVELAQLQYLLPRLQRMWVHLSRIRGGIGLRGPGETQLETDRRMIRRRISRLKEQLAKVDRHRKLLRRGRHTVPTAAVVGYTNAGKSSLLRALTGAAAFVEDRLFATLDTKVRETTLNGGPRVRVVDTVGFIRKLPHDLVASFRATLAEAADADLLLHVIDASRSAWEQHVAVVNRVLEDVTPPETPVIHVFNKMDLVSRPDDFARGPAGRLQGATFVSAAREDIAPLVERLRALLCSAPLSERRA